MKTSDQRIGMFFRQLLVYMLAGILIVTHGDVPVVSMQKLTGMPRRVQAAARISDTDISLFQIFAVSSAPMVDNSALFGLPMRAGKTMGNFDFKLSTHLSIAWGITLAILTVIEWNSLGREPMRAEILSPFIQRVITVTMDNGSTPQVVDFSDAAQKQATQGDGTRLEVEFLFNGPLFLAFFFIPVLAFNGLEWLLGKLNRKPGNGSPP